MIIYNYIFLAGVAVLSFGIRCFQLRAVEGSGSVWNATFPVPAIQRTPIPRSSEHALPSLSRFYSARLLYNMLKRVSWYYLINKKILYKFK